MASDFAPEADSFAAMLGPGVMILMALILVSAFAVVGHVARTAHVDRTRGGMTRTGALAHASAYVLIGGPVRAALRLHRARMYAVHLDTQGLRGTPGDVNTAAVLTLSAPLATEAQAA